MVPPQHSAGASDGAGKSWQFGGCKVQLTANVPVDINIGHIGEIAVETIDPLAQGQIGLAADHTYPEDNALNELPCTRTVPLAAVLTTYSSCVLLA
mgnify:CR=1 FL=1